jgi:hypothetical protein
MILFLDFDGVLHPNEVYYYQKRGVVLECDGHALFEHADTLVELLEPHPEVSIVLSTSWVSVLRFSRAKSYLPESLQKRVRGATWHSAMGEVHWWNSLSRYEQIALYVRRHNLTDWVAVDDNDAGWPDDMRHHLVHTDEWAGLGQKAARESLAHKLANGTNNEPLSHGDSLRSPVQGEGGPKG